MEQKQKSHIRPIVIVMIFVFITIGYAYLTSSLNINGSTLLKKPTWDVHFENIQVKDGSVTGEQVIDEPEIDSEQTTVTFHVNLKVPGDFYEFTVDAVNAGTIDAMIDNYSNLELTAAQQKYLETSITYEDGEEVLEHQQLLVGDTAVYKVRVAYKLDLEAEDLPSSPEQLDLEFSVEFVQRDESAIRRRVENTLYNVLKDAAENTNLAEKYNYSHQDSMNVSLSTKDVYHWYASNNSNANAILDKWNVIFADQCWQIIRTTDTGGVKMIYNGEVEDGKCLNTRGNHIGYYGVSNPTLSSNYWYGTSYEYDSINKVFTVSGDTTKAVWNDSNYESLIGKYTCRDSSLNSSCSTIYYVYSYDNSTRANTIILNSSSNYSTFGELPFNNVSDSMAHIGYMHNAVYPKKGGFLVYEQPNYSGSLSTSYWYSDSIGWDSTTKKYYLINPYQINSEDDYLSLVGKYTLGNSSQTYTTTEAKYIAYVDSSRYYFLRLLDGNDYNYYNYSYTFGDSYTDNGNGTYTINNTTTIQAVDWYTNYQNIKYKYLCKNASNNTCEFPRYVTNTSESTYEYENVNNLYTYANNFTYSNGKYTLSNDKVTFWNYGSNVTNRNSLNTHHYTCFNSSGECTTLNYVYYVSTGSLPAYIELSNGESIEDAINAMLYSNDVNTINSTIKSGIDLWYEKYMINYSDYLDDVVYCADRVQGNQSTNGWNPNGGDVITQLKFTEGLDKQGLNCTNETDQFSISNPKARLTYKVGLITYNEMILLNYKTVRGVGKDYWLISPQNLMSGQNVWHVSSDGAINGMQGNALTSNKGVRPSVALKSNVFYTDGDGSMANPYVIETN